MGDGGWTKTGVHLATHSFSYDEVNLLKNTLTEKYGIECSIHTTNKNQHRIYIFTKSVPKMIELVKPYFHEDFYYKIDKSFKKP